MSDSIFILAAENSAENYGALIIEEFQKHPNPIKFLGVGGDKFIQKGVDVVIHNHDLAIVGIVEVLSSLWKLKKIQNRLFRCALENKVKAVLLIDYPDFNLRLAKRFKKAGIPVYYYISPTVWAWRYSRVNLIRKYVDHLFIIFPFEIRIFQKENIPFTYTGHPLVPQVQISISKTEMKKKLAIEPTQTTITLLPGSRHSEIHSLLPEMLKALELIHPQFHPRIYLLKADSIPLEIITSYTQKTQLKIQILNETDKYNLINASDIVLTTCGTSNLEIALIGIPFVAGYRVHFLSYALGIKLVKIKLYSIVNILAGKEVIPELIQKRFRAPNIAHALKSILEEPERQKLMKDEFLKLKHQLEQPLHPPQIIYQKIIRDLFQNSGTES